MTRLAEPRSDPRQRLGRQGEQAAERALVRHGMRVIERRYRRRFGEIDLVATDGGVVVFVEVKTRSGVGYGTPAQSVTPLKQRRIARVALAYLQSRAWLERQCRFDVVEVLIRPDGEDELRHIVDAFRLWPNG